jgi:general secretion pathway protein D
MEKSKPIFPSRGRAALLATACLVFPLHAGEPVGGGSLAERERMRRSAAIDESEELLRKGDEAYKAGRYAEAVEAYAGARELIPDAPVSSELRQAATDRYAQAAVEQARFLSRKGDVAGAKETVDKVLREGVAPNDPGALKMRAELDDPIRTNPALTAEHARDVDEVRRKLYTAEGAYHLGKFDEAKKTYEEVLRIDPTNSAARRGMEQVAVAKSGYQKSAYDHTRSEMLGMVDAAWETQISAPDLGVGPEDPGGFSDAQGIVTVDAKLDNIIVPRVPLDEVTIDEALDFLRVASSKGEGGDSGGVNFTVNLGAPDSDTAKNIRSKRFSLQLNQVPLRQVLKYITNITQTSFTTDDYSVIITPAGFTSDELISRTYRVPPNFITSLSSGVTAGDAAGGDDPFGETPKGGLLTVRPSVEEALKAQGITFPEGANANITSNVLRVVNTATNQDIISQIVDAATKTEPVTVAVRVTMIKVQQERLEELGFDWLVNPFGLSANNVFGSGGTVGNTPGRNGSDFVSPVAGTSVDGVPADPNAQASNLMTNGLRSGDQGISNNSIDELISNQSRSQQISVAPGVMGLTGLFSDGQVQMIMRGLNQKKGVDIMARPSVMTGSGQQASVKILREFIYPSEYEPPELPNSVGDGAGSTPVTPATPTAFEMKEVGISLEVTPVADVERGLVDVTLNPEFTDFDGFVNYGSPINSTVQDILGNPTTAQVTENAILMPIFSAQKASTQLSVYDGSTIAIGGLMAESIQTVEDKVPVFGDLPIVGRLFTTKASKPISTAIIFLVHVELLDPTGRPYRNR